MKKLLIADDNLQIIEVLKQYALKENYEVYVEATQKEIKKLISDIEAMEGVRKVNEPLNL